ncbi:MAG TPA: phosphopantetheine-binding protein, partial [Gemmatimonadales bacterium]
TGPALEDVGEEPRTPTEATIARIWAQVLQLDRVGVHANFFELGGHSLLATQVVARIRSALGVAVPLRALFESPTVAALAEQVEIAHRLLEEVAALSPDDARAKMSAHRAPPREARQMEGRSI